LGTVAVLNANKKNLLWHPCKDKESRTAGPFLFLAATSVITDAAGINACVHGFTFYNEK